MLSRPATNFSGLGYTGPMQVRHRLFLLVLVTVVLPFVIELADSFVLVFARDRDWPVPISLAALGWLVVQTGMICYFAGQWLPNWGWRLGFLGWWVLLSNRGSWYWGPHPIHVAYSSAQIGALAFWMILGSASWWRRLAIFALAFVPVFLWGEAGRNLLGWQSNSTVRIIVVVQTVAICILASALNAGGYRIERESKGGPGPVQFSIRHLLIATLMVAIMVSILQEMLNAPSPSLSGRQRLHASFNGVVLAVISLVAMWAALGAGPRLHRRQVAWPYGLAGVK